MWMTRQAVTYQAFRTPWLCGKETNRFPQSHRTGKFSHVFHKNITDKPEVALPESGASTVPDSPDQILNLDFKAGFGSDFILDLLNRMHHRRMVSAAELHTDLGG